jgi:glycosyltransferase involved in cell wall biosynthesis
MTVHILFITNYYPPEIAAAANLYEQLGYEFVRRGHEITVLTGMPRYNVSREIYNQYKASGAIEKNGNIKAIRARVPYVARGRTLRRGFEQFEIAGSFSRAGKRIQEKVDVALVCSPPLTLYRTAHKLSEKHSFPEVLGIQDVFPQNAIDLGIMRNKYLIKFFERMERKAYNLVDAITVQSEGHLRFVEPKVNDKSKIHILQNWIDTNQIMPGSKKNAFSEKYKLEESFVVSYAGTMGHSQDMDVIVSAANLMKKEKIRFIIAGSGVQETQVRHKVNELNLKNLTLLPMLSYEEYKQLLDTSDISLVTLKTGVETPTVPSKIISIMASGKPVIASMNPEGDAPKLIVEADCGFVVGGNAQDLADRIMDLFRNKEMRERLGINGRRYIEQELSVQIAADKLEKIFDSIM